MRKIQRLAAIGAMAALTVALGACGDSEEPGAAPAGEPAATAPETTEPAPHSTAPPAEGVTAVSDIVGTGCDQLPADGEGSAAGMVDDQVVAAVSNNPQLSTLEATIKSANLVDTLNSGEALTVFAPLNSAFEGLPPGTFEELTTDPEAGQPNSQLAQVLTTHVVSTRYDAQGLQEASTVPSLQGTELTIGGTAPDALTVSSGEVIANVVCANIPTANATVFLIDKVLMPATS